FDLIWRQTNLQAQMQAIETDIGLIEQNANLSDTEKMFALQMAANTWHGVATARTNILKCVSDVLKANVRNIAWGIAGRIQASGPFAGSRGSSFRHWQRRLAWMQSAPLSRKTRN